MCAGPDKALGWYSDTLTIKLKISEEKNETRAPSALSEIPADDPVNPGNPLFLSADDPWFVAMQQVRPSVVNLHLLLCNARCRCPRLAARLV
jgi:hypothetical protein